MDHHHHYHHRDPPHHHHPPHHHPPPPPPFCHDGPYNSFLPPPPPPPRPQPSPPFPPSHPPYLSHQPPPFSLSSNRHHHQHEAGFVSSPSHRYPPPLNYDSSHPPPPPPPPPHHRRDIGDDFAFVDRLRFDFREPLPPPPPARVPPRPLSSIVDRQVNFNGYLSPPLPPPPPPPPPFVDAVDRFSRGFRSPMIAEEFHVDSRLRLRRFDDDRMNVIDMNELPRPRVCVDDERRNANVCERDDFRRGRNYDDWRNVNVFDREEVIGGRSEQWRSTNFVERGELCGDGMYEDWRSFKDVEREELLHRRLDERRRIMDGIVRDQLIRYQTLVENDGMVYDRISHDRGIVNDFVLHDVYHPEVSFRDRELSPGRNEFVRGEVVDEIPPIRDENVGLDDFRHGCDDVRGDDVSRSPIKFQGREIEEGELIPEFYEAEMKHGLYAGRRKRERVRVDMHEWNNHSPNSPRKKSAFLRLQPAIPHTDTIRNRLGNNTPSPRKGKMIKVESLDHRSNGNRAGGSVDLDVSFKANSLVAKAIVATPSSSKGDCNETISESPLRARRFRNGGKNSPVPKREGKQSEDKASVSPILHRVGIRKIAEVRDNSSDLSSSRCSSLSGGGSTCSKSSLEGEVLSKDDKGADFSKESSPSIRRKRKALTFVSRLSASVPTKEIGTDVAYLACRPSSGFVSDDTPVVHSEASFSTCNVIRSSQDHKSDNEKMSVSDCSTTLLQEEDVVHPISEKFLHDKVQTERLQSLSDAPGPLEPRCEQDEPGISNSDDVVALSVGKRSSDINGKKGDDQVQRSALVLVGNGSVEGSSERIALSIGDNMVNNDISFGRTNTCDSLAATNSTTCQVDSSILTENRIDLASSVVYIYDPQGFSLESGIIGQQFGDVHMDEAVSSHLGVGMKSESSPSIDVSSDDTVSIDCVKVTTISDIAFTNDLQEQENLVNDEARERREGFLESCVSMDGDAGHVALPSVQEDIFPPDKKKAENEPDILDPGTSESFRDTTMSRSMPYRDATLSADRYSLVASSSPCCISESDVSYENGSIRTCVEAKLVMGHVCDLDPEDYRCSCRKRRQTSFLDSNFSGTSTSKSADIRESANALKSIAVGPLYCVNSRAQAAGGFSSTLLSPEDVVEATNNQQTVRTALGDSSEVEVLHKDSHSSVEEFAHVSAKQSSYRAQSGCNRTDDSHLMGAGNCLETELIGSDSESVVGKNDWNSCEDCIQPYLAADLNDRSQLAVMECESKIAGKGNLASVSDRPIICTESTQEIVPSQPAVLGSPLNVGSLGVCCQVSSPSDISIPATHANSYNKFSGNVKKTQSLKPLGSPTSQSTFGCRGIQMNMKPDISPPARNQQLAQKTASVPSKPAKKGVAISSTMSRQFCWKNELTHGKMTPSPQVPTVSTFSSRSLATIPAKPRTWNRTNNLAASSSDVRKPSLSMPPPQKPPYRNFLKVQDTSYIRKGNSLVRNSASSTATPSPHVFTRSVIQGKPIDINKTGKLKSCGTINSTVSPDCLIKGGQHTTIDMPKLSHLPYREKTPDSNIASPGELTSSLEINQSEGMDISAKVKASETALDPSRNPHNVPDKSLEDPGTLSDGVLQASNTKTVIYIKRKSNQLIAASTPHLSSREKSGLIMGNKVASSSDTSYYKRRKNQLVRASSESNIMKMVGAAADNFDSRPPKALTAHLGRSPTKRLFRRVKSLKASLVWKLGDPKSPDKAPEPLRSKQLLSHLLPWKRATYWRSVWRASASISNCSSSMKTRKLPSSRNQAVLYVRSGRGFSLRRSKVISLAGSLKWSKSMEKRAKKVDEDAALAVAASDSARRQKSGLSDVSSESGIGNFSSHKSVYSLKVRSGERIFRVGVFRYRMDPSRRTLQRIPDEEERDSTIPKTGKFARKTYVPKRLLIGSNEYVRIGNGNQLVRDPKRRTRILASEKVRWSLHTARMRLAKKRRFCQFFTRFGRCNKSEGKCPYVHDASKIAVCTKFLKGLCADLNCKLTHKVIPERMPDCSFFLQGLCSNESCPYRHVNANPKASICESFLRGYCAEGNECQKKHSYLCPEFEATGSCPQGSKCKLYHPKKSTCQKGKILDDQRYIRGRYFDTGLMAAAEESEIETPIHEQEVVPKKSVVISEGGNCGDYISLDFSDDEAGESRCINTEVMYLCEFDALTSPPLDDVDELAKPLCILDTH